jgi:PhnB protein
MPFEVPPWGGRFGMLRDRFGVDWMVAYSPAG